MIGTDGRSSRTKYFMHINLRKLQQTVTDAELCEPEGVDKKFRSAFKRTPSKSKSKVQQGAKSKPESVHGNDIDTNTAPVSKLTGTVTASNNTAGQETLPASISKDGSPYSTDAMKVSAKMTKILPHEHLPSVGTIKKSDGEDIREAEKEISRTLAKLKEPVKIQNKSKVLSKDGLLFTRACATMPLSTLRSVEHMHQARLKTKALNKKKNLVTKVKQDRTTRNAKIENFHRNVREKARDWKSQEDNKLEQQKTKQQERRNSDILQLSQSYDQALEKRQIQLKDQVFAHEFGHQNAMVGSTLLREDHKSMKDTDAVEKKDVVREAREVAQEHHEMVKRYMDLRRLKLLQEGEEARKKLDATMLEVSSQEFRPYRLY